MGELLCGQSCDLLFLHVQAGRDPVVNLKARPHAGHVCSSVEKRDIIAVAAYDTCRSSRARPG